MLISPHQKDALTMLIKMAFSRRTEASLSQLIGSPVIIELSDISFFPLCRMTEEFALLFPGQVASIQQSFTGYMSGDALLMFDYYNALTLTNLLDKHHSINTINRHYIDASASDILVEIGNILLNSYLSILSNLLQIQIAFTIPCLQINLLSTLIESLICGKNELRYGLVIPTTFRLYDKSINANLILVSGVVSLHILIKAIETWADMANASQISYQINKEFSFE